MLTSGIVEEIQRVPGENHQPSRNEMTDFLALGSALAGYMNLDSKRHCIPYLDHSKAPLHKRLTTSKTTCIKNSKNLVILNNT